MSGLAQAGAALLGGTLRRAERLHGGDLSEVVRIVLADGRTAVVKGGGAPLVEAGMLRAIAASGCPAPEVLAASDRVLVLEALAGGGSLDTAWRSLGAALARLHAVRGGSYGWTAPYGFGVVPIDNSGCEDWPAFWAARRLLVHVRYVDAELGRRVERLARGLADRLPARPPAVLLHGDLWGGNVLVAEGAVSGLIDPACYHGHCEVDIAMLGLFDRPGGDFFAAYGALEPGHELRRAIYQLWPALVHVRLFGASYHRLVDSLLISLNE
jgi:fructosamine-3-kinase